MPRLLFILLLLMACGGNPSGNPASPRRGVSCAEGQTAFVDVTNELDQGVNLYAYVSTAQSNQFVGVAQPGRSTHQMPHGARSVYVAGHTATEIPIRRTGVDAAVRFEYRCE